jgi:uncharacterized protein YjbI with pentapeptide repeats
MLILLSLTYNVHDYDIFMSFGESAIFIKSELMKARFFQAKLREIDFTDLDMCDVDLTLTTLSYAKIIR